MVESRHGLRLIVTEGLSFVLPTTVLAEAVAAGG